MYKVTSFNERTLRQVGKRIGRGNGRRTSTLKSPWTMINDRDEFVQSFASLRVWGARPTPAKEC